MCVILAAVSARPSRKALKMAADANRDGAGIAWVEGGAVRFRKSLEIKEIIELAATVTLPFVVHFRIATVGAVSTDLCHPFPLNGDSTRASGKTAKGVLFHNGTWQEWKDDVRRAVLSTGTPLGDGPMSDSRAMAWLAGQFGTSIVATLPETQRIALVTPQRGVERFGRGWTPISDGLYASNMLWCRSEPRYVAKDDEAYDLGRAVARELRYEREPQQQAIPVVTLHNRR